MNTTLNALAIVISLFSLMSSVFASPIPLRPGLYFRNKSIPYKYIEIAKKGNKYCYHGVSTHGVSYASLIPVPNHPNIYKLAKESNNESDNLYVAQTDKENIDFGTMKEVINHASNSTSKHSFGANSLEDDIRKDSYIQQCFNSQKPFSLIIPSRH
ncbi:hypothetical protein G7B40_039795 [Aetokthonos hydrillicola Thurmond2011]|jgi:hypothetical protein|uniref:Uncharacterized protein n=1 Tax=Aetokthonos hydrillicola Thurmond2011 TaxID=2712845 RepID=A0AAP5MEA3_9CYAN|nr:hypothetical protein [Aetokthonos hydrillicola]MBW4590135.1 hypothetical protein [Aetokthonos hydrillicola CCALA 1050]MDR9900634.1 hypothetical protein [Aetokthonos hydrillicola Thurmond2011]